MTREEAIQIINGEVSTMSERENEALDMAVRSLEAWDEVDDLVNKTYWAFPVGLDHCLDRLTEIMKEVEDAEIL